MRSHHLFNGSGFELNIIEVVLASTILLVLAVSVAQAAVRISESGRTEGSPTGSELAGRILRNADQLGYLRPFIYNNVRTTLGVHLNASIMVGMTYWLYEIGGNCLTNSQLSCANLSTFPGDIFSSTLYLSGFLTDGTAHIARLALAGV